MSAADEEVLFANEAFYAALASRDIAAMARVWHAEEPVACVHPGWAPLYGRRAVLRSWQAIFDNPQDLAIRVHRPCALVQGEAALVVCFEEIAGQFLVATNVYRRARGGWRLVHHHAGPTAQPPEPESEPGPGRETVH